MSEQTPQESPEESTNELHSDAFMWADSLFDDVVRNQGNDESFTWLDIKKSTKYKVVRLKQGTTIDDDSKCYKWEIHIDNNAEEPISYVMDTPNYVHRNTNNEMQPDYARYTMDVVYSLQDKESKLRKDQPYMFGSDGELVPNPRHTPPLQS